MDGQKGIIDQNLNLVVLGNFQEVAKPIGNKTLAKIDNKWQLIEIKKEAFALSVGRNHLSS